MAGFTQTREGLRTSPGSSGRMPCGWGRFFTLASLVVAMLLVACSATSAGSVTPAYQDGSWRLCLYLCGSNLESKQGWATKTLKELEDARLPSTATVIVQAGGASAWKSADVAQDGQRLIVRSGKLADAGACGEGSMGESDTLADFLEFCEREYPAEHTAVVLWDHGGGSLKGVCFDENAKLTTGVKVTHKEHKKYVKCFDEPDHYDVTGIPFIYFNFG